MAECLVCFLGGGMESQVLEEYSGDTARVGYMLVAGRILSNSQPQSIQQVRVPTSAMDGLWQCPNWRGAAVSS